MRLQITALVFVLYLTTATSQTDTALAAHPQDSLSALQLPMFSDGASGAEAGGDQDDVSGLLQASRDVFMQFATFQFSTSRFRLRGLPASQHQVMINGIDLSNPETGSAAWSSWGGLNDVTRFTESRFGLTPNPYGFSSLGGYTNMESRASLFRPATRVAYATGDRIFRHRLMITYSTGMSRQGWAFAASASVRHGNEVKVPGTFFSAMSFYMSADKRISRRHLLSLTAFVAPLRQGGRSSAVIETFSLSGDNSYNPAWGLQNGEVRNARVSSSTRPTAMLSHLFSGNRNKLTSTICVQTGSSGVTGILSADAPNMQPDYYRYLPSYFYTLGDTTTGDLITAMWRDDPSVRQINWDRMISMNRMNFYTPPGELGQAINTTETRGRYLLENRVEQQNSFILNTVFERTSGAWRLNAGINVNSAATRKYKIAEDLLGATFWLDEDQFAEELGVEETVRQNDIDKPGRKVRQGEKFGYDYTIHVRRASLWAQQAFHKKHLEGYASVVVEAGQTFREGHIANGKFPSTSRGTSVMLASVSGAMRAGLTYKFSARHYLVANAAYGGRPQPPSNLFISPTVRNDVLQDPGLQKFSGVDLGYHMRTPYTQFRFTLYHNSLRNQVWLRSFWHDGYSTTINMIMTGVNNLYQGCEFGVQQKFRQHQLDGVAALAGAWYQGRPALQAWQDNNSRQLFSDRTVYLNNYRSNSSPQLAAGAAYRYNGRRAWFVSLASNYFARQFVEVNPDRRTAEAIEKYVADESPFSDPVIAQQQLPAYLVMNFSAGKLFRVRKKNLANINLSVLNLLGHTASFVSGYEQLRWTPQTMGLFPPKYLHLPGRSFLLITSYSF